MGLEHVISCALFCDALTECMCRFFLEMYTRHFFCSLNTHIVDVDILVLVIVAVVGEVVVVVVVVAVVVVVEVVVVVLLLLVVVAEVVVVI